METSPRGIALLKRLEGFSAVKYDDGTGVMTIGYGTTEADVGHLPERISEAHATALLIDRLRRKYEPAVRELFERGPLRGLYNQNRFDALILFAYNLGIGAVQGAPGFETIWREINSRNLAGITAAMPLYSNPADPVVHLGLLRRRHIEASLFNKPIGRFEDFTAEERSLVLSFDALAGHRSAAARAKRRELERRMRKRLEALRRASHDGHGWDYKRRRERAEAMKHRMGA